MNDSNKVLKIIFVILLLITACELFYFLVYQSPKLNKKTTNLSPTIIRNNIISDDNLVINRDQIKYLSTLKKIDADQLKAFYSLGGIGIVTNIKNITDKQVSFDLTDENGKKSTNIKFPIIEDIPFQIYQSNNNIMTPITLRDLSEGSKIKFLWIYDLTKTPGQEAIYNNELIIYKNSNEKIY